MLKIITIFWFKLKLVFKSFFQTKKSPERNHPDDIYEEINNSDSFIKFVYDEEQQKLKMLHTDINILESFNSFLDQKLVDYLVKTELGLPLIDESPNEDFKTMFSKIAREQKEDYNLHYPPSKFNLGSTQNR